MWSIRRQAVIVRYRGRQQRRRLWCRIQHRSHERIRAVDQIAFPQGPSGKPRVSRYHFECRRCGWRLQ